MLVMTKIFFKNKTKTLLLVGKIPLIVSANDEMVLLSTFEAGKQLYNPGLRKAMGQLKLAKQSTLYQAAKKTKPNRKDRQKAVYTAKKLDNYGNYYPDAFDSIISIRSNSLGKHRAYNTAPKLGVGDRAFIASLKVAFGVAKKGRFKGGKQLNALAGNALANWQRKPAMHRKSLHRRLVDEILSLGNTIKLENVQMEQRVDFLAVIFDLCSTVAELYDHDGYK